ncbi:hypothetical protein [Nocardia wallacei]|uniref:hypothetical protein n=1 Tax=Nocardia wallacei TaxID=480035 RepID=UPI0024544A05|nr:hypothetical protein [Nocardia wallacei]
MGIRQCGQALLVVAGLINTVPALGALSVGKAYAACGISPGGSDVAVLLRHRAVLFAIIGIGLVVAAFRPNLRAAAIGANAISFAGFLAVVSAEHPVDSELVRVAIVDLVGLAVLAGGTILVRAGGNER